MLTHRSQARGRWSFDDYVEQSPGALDALQWYLDKNFYRYDVSATGSFNSQGRSVFEVSREPNLSRTCK
jgi:hypothetical protein